MQRIVPRLTGAVIALLFATSAGAGSFAGTINEEKGIAILGHDPVAYFTAGKPMRGLPKLAVKHEGATFLFATIAHRDSFAKNPARWAPAYGGFCAYGMSKGYKAVIDPAAFTVVDGRLYLNYNAQVKMEWSKDAPKYIDQANRKWPEVAKTAKVHR